MILSLRQRHRRIFRVIACVLPIVMVVGIAARRSAPLVTALPPAVTGVSDEARVTEWERSDLFPDTPLVIRAARSLNGEFTLTCAVRPGVAKPDVIVYWVPGSISHTRVVPDSAILLGSLSAEVWRLPASAGQEDGSLLLFSLADQAVIDRSQPVRLDPTRR